MAEPKTKPTGASVEAFLAGVADEEKRADSRRVLEIMRAATGEEPVMWGPSIVGFGRRPYAYASGRTGEWMVTGFSPRKAALTLYLMSGAERYAELLARLGKHKTGKSCLYVKRLRDVDEGVLAELVQRSVDDMRRGDVNYGVC